MESGQIAAVLSRAEIEVAIQSFTRADWVRLEKTAHLYSSGRPIEANDLLQEAFLRALNSRGCPVGVDVVKFLAEAMRSIAHGEKEKVTHRLILVSVAKNGDLQDQLLNAPDPTESVENKMINEQKAAAIRRDVLALFDDDPKARDIVEGIMEDMNADELRELTDLDKTDYDSKRKLIRRRILKSYPKGWKS